jgi:hypothetical protein
MLSGAGWPWGERRIGPVPARCPALLVRPSRGFRRHRAGPGYGVGWADLDPDEDQPSADIWLMPEQVIEGRLVDVHGQPVPGALVSVSAIWRTQPIVLAKDLVVENRLEGPFLWWGRAYDRPGWPKSVTTDADGRFDLHGIGCGVHARLGVFDPRFAPQTIEVATDAPGHPKPLKWKLQPAWTLTGRVTYADNGRPAAYAEVQVGTATGPGGIREGGVRYLAAAADADGRFRVGVMPGDHINVWADAADEQLYLRASTRLEWPNGAAERTVVLALPRGVLLRGQVVEDGTGRPVVDAMVAAGGGWALTKPDGTFAFAVEPRPGHLSVQAPGEDYELKAIDSAQYYVRFQRLNGRRYAHAFVPYDPGPGAEPPEIRAALRRGPTVKFRLIGPDGQPVPDVLVYSRAVLGPAAASATRFFPLPWSWNGGRTSRPFPGPWARPGDRCPRPLPPAGAQARRDRPGFGQDGRTGAGDRPPRTLWHGHGAAGRRRRPADHRTARLQRHDGHHAGFAGRLRGGEGR